MTNEHSQIIALIHSLSSQDKYIYKKHAREQMNTRNMTDDDVKDILSNVKKILRTDNNNQDGITSYKIEGGEHNHRLAIKFHQDELIIIITVMDKR